jgi:hypothetical protein
MARRIAPAALIALAMAWAFVAFAAPSAFADGATGTVSGVLTNGTRATPAGDQQVTLQLTVGSSVKNLATVTTAANGAFTFSGVDASPASLGGAWAVFTTYQSGLYSSAPLTVTAGKTVDASFAVYDATQDSANLRVSVATILVRSVDATHGLVSVAEFITIENTGTTAFVGQTPSGTAATMPPLLRFSIPPSAINLSTGAGFYNTQIIQVDTDFAATATVPPGPSEFAFAFQMPYTGTTLTLPFKAVYPVEQLIALVPPSMLARDTTGLASQGIVTTLGARYQVYTATNLEHDAQVTLSLYDLPQAGERSDLSVSALLWLAGALATLLALFAGLYVWRGAFFPAPGAQAGVLISAGTDAERKHLLQATLDLERRHARGDVSDDVFKRENAALRQRLRDLLAGEEPARASQLATDMPVAQAMQASDEPAAVFPATPEAAPGSKGGAR